MPPSPPTASNNVSLGEASLDDGTGSPSTAGFGAGSTGDSDAWRNAQQALQKVISSPEKSNNVSGGATSSTNIFARNVSGLGGAPQPGYPTNIQMGMYQAYPWMY